MSKKNKLFNTKVIHSGHKEDAETGAVMPPIHLSSTFKQNSPGKLEKFAPRRVIHSLPKEFVDSGSMEERTKCWIHSLGATAALMKSVLTYITPLFPCRYQIISKLYHCPTKLCHG